MKLRFVDTRVFLHIVQHIYKNHFTNLSNKILANSMTSNLTFINQSIARASLYSSRLPQQCNKLQHLSNNLVSKGNTNLLYIGQDMSYSIYENTHAKVTWSDDFSKRIKIQTQEAPYNIIIVSENKYSAKLLLDLKDHLAKNVILSVVNSRMMIAEKLLERSVGFVPSLKIVSRVEIYDRNDEHGWQNGVLVYDIVNKDL
jgi:hypothetical protein